MATPNVAMKRVQNFHPPLAVDRTGAKSVARLTFLSSLKTAAVVHLSELTLEVHHPNILRDPPRRPLLILDEFPRSLPLHINLPIVRLPIRRRVRFDSDGRALGFRRRRDQQGFGCCSFFDGKFVQGGRSVLGVGVFHSEVFEDTRSEETISISCVLESSVVESDCKKEGRKRRTRQEVNLADGRCWMYKKMLTDIGSSRSGELNMVRNENDRPVLHERTLEAVVIEMMSRVSVDG